MYAHYYFMWFWTLEEKWREQSYRKILLIILMEYHVSFLYKQTLGKQLLSVKIFDIGKWSNIVPFFLCHKFWYKDAEM